MKRTLAVAGTVILGIAMATAQLGHAAKDQSPQTRTLTGMVSNQHGRALSDSVVYLTNSRTMAVKTYIVGKDGSYRFPLLSPNVDYQVYAQFQGHKSDTKTLSSFDSRANAVINLKIDVK